MHEEDETTEGVDTRGYLNPLQTHGPVEQLVGDPEVFKMDIWKFHKRQKAMVDTSWKWWVAKDNEADHNQWTEDFPELTGTPNDS